MGNVRQKKFASLIQKELAEIFQRDVKNLLPNNIISIQMVEISPDLTVAKIYLGMLMAGNKKETFDRINSHKSEIRRALGKRIGKHVRRVPELIFYLDEGAEHADYIEAILNKLDIPPEADDVESKKEKKD